MSHLSFEPNDPSRRRGDGRSADDHISGQRLAALADEQPTADENAHLTQCADCAREREAHRSLLTMAGSEREALGLPLTRWDSLSERLREEGLIVGGGKWAVGRNSHSPLRTSHWGMRVAAALLFMAAGVALGRATTNEPMLPGITDGATATQSASVRIGAPDSLPRTFASIEEATRWKDFYSRGYQNALAFLAQNDSEARPAGTPAVMKTRLAALDKVTKMMQEALSDAPSDPVINDFYLNSWGQREATLRQLNNVLPQNVRLNSF